MNTSAGLRPKCLGKRDEFLQDAEKKDEIIGEKCDWNSLDMEGDEFFKVFGKDIDLQVDPRSRFVAM
jgi:hypothetical protein